MSVRVRVNACQTAPRTERDHEAIAAVVDAAARRTASADICHHRAALQRLERYVALLTRGQGSVEVRPDGAIVRVPASMLERVTAAMSIAHATVKVSTKSSP